MLEKIIEEVKKRTQEERSKALRVAVLGQTGVGKSSLINSLFGTHLPTDDVKPCTKEIEAVPVGTNYDSEIIFYDLPGIGESPEADEEYLDQYLKVILQSDIVLWAIHTDTRSTTFDNQSLQILMQRLTKSEGSLFINKLVVVITKIDLLHPEPWILAHDGEEVRLFTPERTLSFLNQKSTFFQDSLLQPYCNIIKAHIWSKKPITVKNSHFKYKDNEITFDGLPRIDFISHLEDIPEEEKQVLGKLVEYYMPVACSARFKLNLEKLIEVIINRLDFNGIQRFYKFIEAYTPPKISFYEVKSFSNITVFNKSKGKVVFSLSDYFDSLQSK